MEHVNDDFFAELTKIANESIMPEDLDEAMNPDLSPHVDPAEVEAIQAQNAESGDLAEQQLPPSPEEAAELEAALASAQQELAVAKQAFTEAEEAYTAFEKTASELNDQLPYLGALAKLFDISTDNNSSLQKEASERLTAIFQSEEQYQDVLTKTAQELFFANESNLNELYTREGMEYVADKLASFSDEEELNKVAFEMGGVFGKVKQVADTARESMGNLFKVTDEINAAQAEVQRLDTELSQLATNIVDAKEMGDDALVAELEPQHAQLAGQYGQAEINLLDAKSSQRKKQVAAGAGAAGVVGGGLFAGKKIYDAKQNSSEDSEEVLSDKTAGVKMMKEESEKPFGGGIINMSQSIVGDFLKIAGAAFLIDVAGDENQPEELRKEAGETFNTIARLGRSDMDEAFVKVATHNLPEEHLHQIVKGDHNEELFGKIANFVALDEMSIDEFEKVASAEGVAAKGVAGALTDAKKNIEEKIEADKTKTETVHNGELGNRKSDDMRGYNVINNPGQYQVEKTAGHQSILEQAQLQKEAAFKAYVELDTFIKNNA